MNMLRTANCRWRHFVNKAKCHSSRIHNIGIFFAALESTYTSLKHINYQYIKIFEDAYNYVDI